MADAVFLEAQRLAEEAAGFHIGIIHLPRRSTPHPGLPPGAEADYCALIRTSELLVRRCDQSDERGAALCAKRGGPVAYQCHAGMTEVIAPVMVGGRMVACVNCGQVFMKPPTRADFARLWSGLKPSGLDRDELERAYLEQPVASEERVRMVARILAITAEHLGSKFESSPGEGRAPARPAPAHEPQGRNPAGYLTYCAKLVAMIEAGAADDEVVRGMDRLAARLAAAAGSSSRTASAAVEYFVEHYAGRPSLGDAARRAGLTPYYLGKVFRRAVGMTPAAFLRGLRMNRARELLASEPELSVAAIAARVGYPDPAYFSRHFQATFGTSAMRVRRGI